MGIVGVAAAPKPLSIKDFSQDSKNMMDKPPIVEKNVANHF
jgi:hypothetical protein